MKIYVVTSGTYSDYQIEAVFTTEENAKAFIDKHGDYDNRRIEEYDADSEDLERETATYTVHIDSKNTSVVRDNSCYKADTIKAFKTYNRDGVGLSITVETDGAERAKKIASERLMQVKAMPYLFPRLYEECVGYKLYTSTLWHYPTYDFHTKEILLDKGEFLKE